MKRTTGPGRGVVVVDRRPLERSLVRFILQENGFEVTAEAATPAEALRAVERRAPAVVVLHENAAWERGQPTIPLLRDLLPEAKVLVIAPAFGVVRVELLRDADAVLEEGVGFKDLPFVIGRLSNGDGAKPAAEPPAAVVTPISAARRKPGRWVDRIQGASAAAILFLAVVIARGVVPPSADQPVSARLALTQAQNHLDGLTAAAESDNIGGVLQEAVALYRAYTTASAAGADTTGLERRIATMMNTVVPTLPAAAQQTLAVMFGGLPGVTVSPAPTATPTPTETPPPTETPSPEPTDTGPPDHGSGGAPPPSPPPPVTQTSAPPPETQSPSPTETETETPSPSDTETETPPPTQTETPSPTDSGSQTQTPSGSGSQTQTPSSTQTDTGSPSPSSTGEPSVTETPSPTNTPTPSPSETQQPSPTETHTQTPPPSATEPPTETPSTSSELPSPSITQADARERSSDDDRSAALLVWPGLGIVASGIARRRARRSGR